MNEVIVITVLHNKPKKKVNREEFRKFQEWLRNEMKKQGV